MVIIMNDCDIVVMRIDARKKALNLHDSDIENYIGANRGTVSKWRNKNVKSYTSYLFPLAEIWKTTIAYLVGETDDPTPKTPATTNGDGLSEKHRTLIELFDCLDDVQQTGIIAQLQALVQLQEALDGR